MTLAVKTALFSVGFVRPLESVHYEVHKSKLIENPVKMSICETVYEENST